MKKIKKTLKIERETVRILGENLTQVNGGWTTASPSDRCISLAAAGCTEGCPSQNVTQCAGLCTTNPWTANCPVSQ